jgi:hypothetical protein
MYRLKISKVETRNNISEYIQCEKIKRFHNHLVDLTESHLSIFDNRGEKVLDTDLKHQRDDGALSIYLGYFDSVTKFGVVRSTKSWREFNETLGATEFITFVSLKADDYSISFDLPREDDKVLKSLSRTPVEVINHTHSANIENLIIEAKDVYMVNTTRAKDNISHFLELLKRNPMEILNFHAVDNIILGMKLGAQLDFYDETTLNDRLNNIEILFESSKHQQIVENEIRNHSSDPDGMISFNTLIRIVPNFKMLRGYICTIISPESKFNPIWGDEYWVTPNTTVEKATQSKNSIELQGFGSFLTDEFNDCSFIINLVNFNIENIVYRRKESRKTNEGYVKYMNDITFYK